MAVIKCWTFKFCTFKFWNNYIRNYIKTKEYNKVGDGICINKNEDKLETHRFLKFGKFISKKECEQKTRKYLGIAYTFTYKKNAINLKYNCLIHFLKNMENIQNIIFDNNVNNGRYKKSECYKIKTN